MSIDVERARSCTPGTAHVNHLNNAGSSLPPQPVIDAVVGHLQLEASIGGYEAAAQVADDDDRVYGSVAALVGCRREEIALVESATVAWNAAFTSIPFRSGDRILTGRSEYVSNAINLLIARQRYGVEVVVIDDDEHGQISLPALRAAVDDRTALIALTHVPTSGGLVNPAAAVGRIARDAGVLYLLDACQSAGQLVLDVDTLQCDMLSVTGRKFLRGPRGTGFLYVRSSALDRLRPQSLDVRSASWVSADRYEVTDGARRFETWEASIANRLGLGAAVDHAMSWGIAAIAERSAGLAASLRDQLAAQPGVHVHDKGVDRCAIVTFTVDGVEATAVQSALHAASINTSVTGAGSARFDLPARGLDQLVRASPHYYNTDDEIGRLVEVVAELTA